MAPIRPATIIHNPKRANSPANFPIFNLQSSTPLFFWSFKNQLLRLCNTSSDPSFESFLNSPPTLNLSLQNALKIAPSPELPR
jgi:hypothetical protein